MNRACQFLASCAAAAAALFATSAGASPPLPEVSLYNCQTAVKIHIKSFINAKVAAVETCLHKIGTEVLKNNVSNPSYLAAQCITQFRKIYDTRVLSHSLSATYAGSIRKKCDPSQPYVTHTLDDVTGKGVGLPQQIDTGNIDTWCKRFGGDGSIDSVQEWLDCMLASAECSADAAISTQYPRALEWLDLIRPAMALVTPPSFDLIRTMDALAGLDQVRTAIAGPGNGNSPNIQCGRPSFPASGQTTAKFASDDGSVKAGAALRYRDGGDGTITDLNTGLMWEKKVALDGVKDAANLHDADNNYPWRGSCSISAALCGTDADCPSPQTCDAADGQTSAPNGLTIFEWVAQLNAASFGGHNDWRVPNAKELTSIVDFGRFPAADTAFNGAGCGAACTDLTDAACSCILPGPSWTATSFSNNPAFAWSVDHTYGLVLQYTKTTRWTVRAVRGGF